MKSKNIVYWGFQDFSSNNNELIFETPSRLIPELYSYYSPVKLSDLNFYFKCPAFKTEFRNTFLVRAHKNYKLEFHWNKERNHCKLTTSDNTLESFEKNFHIRDISYQLGTFKWHHYFFSNSSINMSVTPAYHFDTEFNNNTTFIGGEFNIGKWFRPVDSTFILKEKYNSLTIKKGDPLFYVKFNTNEKVTLKQFKVTSKLDKLSQDAVCYKQYDPFKPLPFLYNLFLNKNYPKRILKGIKSNLV